jgi:hypothetical protein
MLLAFTVKRSNVQPATEWNQYDRKESVGTVFFQLLYLFLDLLPHMTVQVQFNPTVRADHIRPFLQTFHWVIGAAAAQRARNGQRALFHRSASRPL